MVCEKIVLGLRRGPFNKPKQVVLQHEPHVAKLSISIDHDQPAAFDAHTISPNATQHNIGFRAGPISYDHTRNYYFDNLINETQTINVLGYNMYSSDPSMVVSVGLGARLGIGFDLKINLIRK